LTTTEEPQMPRSVTPLLLGALLAATSVSFQARAADEPPPVRAGKPADPLAAARTAIQAQQWPAAAEELRRLNSASAYTNQADWNNLMGYVMRKQAKPDLDAAQRYYDSALRIDPQHMGALEYSGELALMKRDLPTAEARLSTLAQLCKSPCEPLDDLRKSIAAYKAKK
jgi:hypothetical protein